MADKKVTTNKTTTEKNTVPQKTTSTAAKPSATAKPAATAKPTAKTTTTAAKPAAKPTTTAAKPTAAAKPATASTTKPVAKTTPAEAKTTATAAKPAAKPTTAKPATTAAKATPTTEKPAAKTGGVSEKTEKPAKKTSSEKAASSAGSSKASNKKNKAVADSTGNDEEKSGFGAKISAVASAVVKKLGVFNLALIGCAFVLIISLILSIALNTRKPVAADEFVPYNNVSTGLVGYYSENVDGTVTRNIPDGYGDEGLPAYPTYGSTLNSVIGTSSEKVAARNALISESSYLAAYGTSGANNGGTLTEEKYTLMDADGWLYQIKNGEKVNAIANGKPRRLYRHTFSKGLYRGNVSDDEPAVIKKVTLRPRGYGYCVTGVYAPAGEVIKVQLSNADMQATGGITIHIGQALFNGQANNIWSGKNQMQRVPHLLTTLTINKTTATYDEATDTWTGYIGSFIGGPIYVRNTSSAVTVTISGAVNYPHFILGYTTEEEFNEYKKSSAPYFDLEVWSYGVLHSGPSYYARSFNYQQICDAAVLWEKVASVSTTNDNEGIVFLYDPFVAAGAAVAFPGRSSVNCPMSWMSDSLNYNAIITSGAWGNFHEYHHNFQGYGVGNGGEVTNNAMTLVSYALFTKISEKRGVESYGAQGLGGWNSYTSATYALEETLKIAMNGVEPSNGNQGLALYATLLHNFGPDNFIQSKVKQQRSSYGQSYTGYMRAWQDITHYDMTYFFKDVLKGITEDVATQYTDANRPMFVPVSSAYQTGRSITLDGEKKYISTMRPYIINAERPFTVDLRQYTTNNGQYNGQYSYGSVVLPTGFSFKVKSVNTRGLHSGEKFVKTAEDGVYTFTPSSAHTISGEIKVTLEITNESNTVNGKKFEVEDVELVLQFKQSHEATKFMLTRTTYTYAEGAAFTDAEEAYNNNYSNSSHKPITVTKGDNLNKTQNSNTDIWYFGTGYVNDSRYTEGDAAYLVPENSVVEIAGKIGFSNAGKYRIYLRGRLNCALYYSLDNGKTFIKGATIKDANVASIPSPSDVFRYSDPKTYFDVELTEDMKVNGIIWLPYKSVLITQSMGSIASYIGLGYAEWHVPQYRTETKYYDAEGNVITDPESELIVREETTYYNEANQVVTAEQASNVEPIKPTSASYVTAYSANYKADDTNFDPDYFYTRRYNYNYQDNIWQNPTQTIVSHKNYSPYNSSRDAIGNLVDGNRNTYIHTNYTASAARPLEFVIDMGEVKPVNQMRIYTQYRPNGDWHVAKVFTLEGSVDGENFFEVYITENAPASGGTVTANFDEKEFRYYRLVITGSFTQYIIITEIEMWRMLEVNNGSSISPDNDMFKYQGNWTGKKCISTFGHAYAGKKGAVTAFSFTGTRFAIFTPSDYKKNDNIVVLIDGKLVKGIQVKEQTGVNAAIIFMSGALKEGKHTVGIVCNGNFTLDSVVVW